MPRPARTSPSTVAAHDVIGIFAYVVLAGRFERVEIKPAAQL